MSEESEEILWIDNENPKKAQRLISIISIIGIIVLAIVIFLILHWQYQETGYVNLIIIVVCIAVFLYFLILVIWLHRKARYMWPFKIGFLSNRISFKYPDGRSREIRWDEVKNVEFREFKRSESIFPPICLLIDMNGKQIPAEIRGNAAIETHRRFEEYKKQLKKVVNNN
jgi:hypothetical protein